MMRVWAYILVLALMGVAACRQTEKAAPGPVKVCTAVGERCLVSPGKMGICGPTTELTCDEPPCLTCVDQH